MPPPEQVLQLIKRFERNLDHYKQTAYKETQVHVEFIDPFFEALSWDVHNQQEHGEHDYEPSVRPCQHQVEATDHQIDALAHELYGLTEEEIEIVAGVGW